MTTNYRTDDPILGQIDLDDYFIRDQFLIDQFVGSRLYGWGGNRVTAPGPTTVYTGTVGNSSSTNFSSPIQIGSLTNWRTLSTSTSPMAIKTDGTLWVWGMNGFAGSLGLGDTNDRSSPVQVGTLTNWKQVASGLSTLSVKTDGTLWAWGDGGSGMLGLGNLTSRSSPVQVGTLTNWKLVDVGCYHVAAVKTDGTLWAWGRNESGILGLGDIVHRSSPVRVGTLTNWKSISTSGPCFTPGGGYPIIGKPMYAIKTDGTLWAWGYNYFGSLGLRDRVTRSSPVQVGTLTDWKFVARGSYCALALKTNGTLWAIGGQGFEQGSTNSTGELGLGSDILISSPVQIGTLTTWRQLGSSVGAFHATSYPDI